MGEHKFKEAQSDTTASISISESRLSQLLSQGQVEQTLWEILTHGIRPSSVYAKQMRCMLLMRQRKFDEARILARELTKIQQDPLSWKMMGDIEFLSVNYKGAQEAYSRALEKHPDHPDITHDLAVSVVSEGRLSEAIPIFRKACFLAPQNAQFKHHLSLMLLLDGQFREGWTVMESRMDVPGVCGTFPRQEKYWRGEDVQGRHIVLRSEQGFGDTIMFSRYIKRLQSMGARVTAYVQPAMVSFIEHFYPGVHSIPNVAPPPTDFDYHINMMSLGLRFCGEYDTVPARSDGGEGIGICWFGSPTHQADHLRTVPVERFIKLRERYPHEKWYIVAYGRFDQQLPPGFEYYIDDCRDWKETAQKISRLKLVISVDTAIVHLAGFMGTPVWNLVAHVPDFRWLYRGGERTEWYESMKLYRQPKLFDWDSVFSRVEDDLGTFLAHNSSLKAEAA